MQETRVQFLGEEGPLEEEVAIGSSVCAWKSHGQRNLRAPVHGVTESGTTETLSTHRDFSSGPVVENPLCNAGEVGLTPGQGAKI